MNISVLVKTFIVLLTMLHIFQAIAQEKCNIEQVKREIQELKEQHEDELPEKMFVKIFELVIDKNDIGNPSIINTRNTILFTFMGDRIFRHYAYASGVDAKILLKQRTGGFLKKTQEKTFLDVVKKGDDRSITYYDYDSDDENDFLLSFSPINNIKGCALLIVYEIVDKNWKYRKTAE